MTTGWKNRKLWSKFYRLQIAEELREVIEEMGVFNLQENQIGDFIYSGSGTVKTGSNSYLMNLHVKVGKLGFEATVLVPSQHIKMSFPLNKEYARKMASEVTRRCVN